MFQNYDECECCTMELEDPDPRKKSRCSGPHAETDDFIATVFRRPRKWEDALLQVSALQEQGRIHEGNAAFQNHHSRQERQLENGQDV